MAFWKLALILVGKASGSVELRTSRGRDLICFVKDIKMLDFSVKMVHACKSCCRPALTLLRDALSPLSPN